MTAEARALIEQFLSLPQATKDEVLAEIVRIAAGPALNDDELVAAANELFLTYDAREDAD
ncbi:MAG TPA: hypothetical protein VF846_17800 [Thermoanaerobaculia bacterium]|jgi:hypothetical protein